MLSIHKVQKQAKINHGVGNQAEVITEGSGDWKGASGERLVTFFFLIWGLVT